MVVNFAGSRPSGLLLDRLTCVVVPVLYTCTAILQPNSGEGRRRSYGASGIYTLITIVGNLHSVRALCRHISMDACSLIIHTNPVFVGCAVTDLLPSIYLPDGLCLVLYVMMCTGMGRPAVDRGLVHSCMVLAWSPGRSFARSFDLRSCCVMVQCARRYMLFFLWRWTAGWQMDHSVDLNDSPIYESGLGIGRRGTMQLGVTPATQGELAVRERIKKKDK